MTDKRMFTVPFVCITPLTADMLCFEVQSVAVKVTVMIMMMKKQKTNQ